jgi:hypothetical protein
LSRKGRDLELLVAQYERALSDKGIKVASPEYVTGRLTGKKREIDISLRGKVGSAEIFAIVECRDRQGKEDVRWIEQINSKKEDAGASLAIAVSSNGFSETAKTYARAKGIFLRTVEEVNPREIQWLQCPSIGHRSNRVRYTSISLSPLKEDAYLDVLPEQVVDGGISTNTPFFYRKSDRKTVSIDEIWSTLANKLNIYEDLKPNSPKVERIITLDSASFGDTLQLRTANGYTDVDYLEFEVEVWVEETRFPLSATKRYVDETGAFVETAEYDCVVNGEKITFRVHASNCDDSERKFFTDYKKG